MNELRVASALEVGHARASTAIVAGDLRAALAALTAGAAAQRRVAERVTTGFHVAGEAAGESVHADDAHREVVPARAVTQLEKVGAIVVAPNAERP